jgi:hypothetical protein
MFITFGYEINIKLVLFIECLWKLALNLSIHRSTLNLLNIIYREAHMVQENVYVKLC